MGIAVMGVSNGLVDVGENGKREGLSLRGSPGSEIGSEVGSPEGL